MNNLIIDKLVITDELNKWIDNHESIICFIYDFKLDIIDINIKPDIFIKHKITTYTDTFYSQLEHKLKSLGVFNVKYYGNKSCFGFDS